MKASEFDAEITVDVNPARGVWTAEIFITSRANTICLAGRMMTKKIAWLYKAAIFNGLKTLRRFTPEQSKKRLNVLIRSHRDFVLDAVNERDATFFSPALFSDYVLEGELIQPRIPNPLTEIGRRLIVPRTKPFVTREVEYRSDFQSEQPTGFQGRGTETDQAIAMWWQQAEMEADNAQVA